MSALSDDELAALELETLPGFGLVDQPLNFLPNCTQSLDDKGKPLQGYRMGLIFEDRNEERYFKNKGASVLRIHTAPESEGSFKQRWLKEIDRARQDRVKLVVLLVGSWASVSVHGQLLKKIEEAEFHCTDEGGPGRIRTTTYRILDRVSNSTKGLTLTDSWGDTIERGESQVVESLSPGDEDNSCSGCSRCESGDES